MTLDELFGYDSHCDTSSGDGIEIPGEPITTGKTWTILPGADMSRDISWAMISEE